MRKICVYPNLPDVWQEISNDDLFHEFYDRARALAFEFAKVSNDDPEKAERIILSFSNILEPNGYKIIKQDVAP